MQRFKGEEAIEMIGQAGATVLFLPAYCPALNPMEYMAKNQKLPQKTSSTH
jgi:transposase